MDYETRDGITGDVDLTLTSVLSYAHWSPRPDLGVGDLLGAGRGDLKLRDEADKVLTDLEMLMGAISAWQEVEFDIGYGLVTRGGVGLLTTCGCVSLA